MSNRPSARTSNTLTALILTTGLAIAGAVNAAAATVTTITPGKLTYCTSIGAAPYEFNDAGTVKGFVMDYMDALSKQMGLEPVIVDMPFDNIIAATQAGKCDVANATHTITAKRQAQVTMVPFFASGDQILVRKGNPTSIVDDPTSLCGKKFAVVLGQFETDEVTKWSAACVAAGKPAITSVVSDNQPTTYQMLATGQVDAVLTDNAFAAYQAQAKPDLFSLAGSIMFVLPSGIVVSKDNKAMSDAVQGAVCALKKDGTFFKILGKWGISTSIDSVIPYNC